MKQRLHAPLYQALVNHASKDPVSFHVPGHHGNEALQYALNMLDKQEEAINRHFGPLLALDVTELSTTDDLHHPESSIKEAQALAAECFGAEDTYFLVGGSTSGNLALILAVCDPGDIILVQRNVHKSIINGLKLANAKAVFLTPERESITGLATVPSLLETEKAIIRYPEAKAVFLSTPNYYGMSVNMERYAELCHRNGIPLLIDEAHGAHYGFHPELPASAIQAGADAVVQSTHKTLTAMTMGAMLHVRGSLLSRGRLKDTLAMIQSSSPSFPIMASLDISRAIAQQLGPDLFRESIEAVRLFRQWLKEESSRLTVPEREDSPVRSISYDPLRILLMDRDGLLSGYEIQQELERHGCYAEMADPKYSLLVVGPHAARGAIPRLQEAILHINAKYAERCDSAMAEPIQSLDLMDEDISSVSEPVAFARHGMSGKGARRVHLQDARGQLSGEMVIPYPPGIPILYTGERITNHHISQIEWLARTGARFQGAEDDTMTTIAILIEEKDEDGSNSVKLSL
ncbi:aminotransferase class I/II-fold pyridoxal phosphate-dependent enzyme [Paenibacillus soyae]|uniref:Aminotransferase class I/II-fold pyridoxal phosphate-dependent enzyme n=1 Tax=Paenibacillus soyae TaxID=2969249 RepID=A0A9X2MVA8_9BACL|nr:aminotransferase class I/II-fold pyridoxal phosphate-dependent enzyme [Paenibacillus soyae]